MTLKFQGGDELEDEVNSVLTLVKQKLHGAGIDIQAMLRRARDTASHSRVEQIKQEIQNLKEKIERERTRTRL